MVLEVMFSGLIAFVKGECALNDAKKMDILMVKGDDHLPRLVVDVRYVHSSKPDPDEIIEVPGGAQLAIWKLDNMQIEVVDAPKKIQVYEGHRRKKPNLDEYEEPGPGQLDKKADFSWAPEMRRACGLSEADAYPRPEVKRNYRLSYKSSSGQLVQFAAARFAELSIDKTGPKPKRTTNQLETEIQGLDEERQKIFKFKDDSYKQVLADRARLRMVMDNSDYIEIRLNKLSAADEDVKPVLATTIRLKPDPAGVFIAISNLPNVVTSTVGLPEQVLHFHEYEKLLAKDDQITCPVPTEDVEASKEAGVVGGVQPVKCAMCSTCGGPD